jgi:hypothetical protein
MSMSKRPGVKATQKASQNLWMSGFVSLGCWGMAFSFAFLSAEENHFLFAGMAVLMALMWSYTFSTRLRKTLRKK